MKKLTIYFYLTELFYRSFYIFISFCFCLLISYSQVQILFLIETYPFLLFSKKKFIMTYITDLFECIWLLIASTSCLLVFPLFLYHLFNFSKASWYYYQFYFFKWLFTVTVSVYFIITFFSYSNFFPVILQFFTQWELKEVFSILNVEVEFKIFDYIKWILKFRYLINFLTFLFVLCLIKSVFLLNLKFTYLKIKFYRNQFTFLLILVLFLLTPSDFILQFFTVITIILLYEIIFFLLCYKIYNVEPNANNTSTNKNSKEI